ncbi:MAG: 4Fe-4S binding protein [Bacteroidales bacterium]|nr:4Fe-4S binding protein [Bacteroidales bacterium]
MLLYKILKRSRVVLSLLVFAGIAFCFASVWIKATHFLAPLLKLQFVPALLGLFAGTFWACIALLLLTLLFGRLYCSLLCPVGTLQDLFIRKKFRYRKPQHLVRYTILAFVAICWLLGFTLPLLALDPYSNFGRIAVHLFGPVVLWLNNIASNIAPNTLYLIRFIPASNWMYILAMAILLIIVGISFLRGRLLCNTICPVGSFLGLISPFSFFKFAINREACNHCNVCSKKCKAECINGKEQQIDYSRCVVCFNCTLACKQDAISFVNSWKKQPKQTEAALSKGRRFFLASVGGLTGAAAMYRASGGTSLTASSDKNTIAPPGARSHEHLKKYCTACQACVAACPMRIIKPTATGYGLDGWMLPAISFDRGFCSFDCNRCSEVCPTLAIERTALEEKKLIQIGKARFIPRYCVVTKDRTDCGACDEHCPTKAVYMLPWGDSGLRRPQVDEEHCIGCGACEFICPTSPKAIAVQAQVVHGTALPPVLEKQEQINVDDFGF